MSQKLVRRPTTAARTARRSCPCTEAHALDCAERLVQRRKLVSALRQHDPVALANARGLFDSLKALEDWLCDRIFEATLTIYGNVFGGEWNQKEVMGEPDRMQAGGRVRTFHLS